MINYSQTKKTINAEISLLCSSCFDQSPARKKKRKGFSVCFERPQDLPYINLQEAKLLFLST